MSRHNVFDVFLYYKQLLQSNCLIKTMISFSVTKKKSVLHFLSFAFFTSHFEFSGRPARDTSSLKAECWKPGRREQILNICSDDIDEVRVEKFGSRLFLPYCHPLNASSGHSDVRAF